jgi:hypothetical protein
VVSIGLKHTAPSKRGDGANSRSSFARLSPYNTSVSGCTTIGGIIASPTRLEILTVRTTERPKYPDGGMLSFFGFGVLLSQLSSRNKLNKCVAYKKVTP